MKRGSLFVVMILVLGTIGSGLTFWNYSQHVFSSNRGKFVDQAGTIEAIFPARVLKKVQPHQRARVSIGKSFLTAEVVSVTTTDQGLIISLCPMDKDHFSKIKATAGDSCDVTIDTTIPCDSQ